jgi:hypothetical protein
VTVRDLARFSVRAAWRLNGRVGPVIGRDLAERATVLITYFAPERLRHAAPQLRNVLRCACVERVIALNHNPEVTLGDLGIDDPRLVVLDHPERRGCGHRWSVAARFDPAHLIVIDDDLLLFSWQVGRLFRHLLEQPEVPHGLAGMVMGADGSLEYLQRRDQAVDLLCEAYAVTRQHLRTFARLSSAVAREPEVASLIEQSADFVVLSRAGTGRPLVHDEGRILRCPTFDRPGVAIHKGAGFSTSVGTVLGALARLDVPADRAGQAPLGLGQGR